MPADGHTFTPKLTAWTRYADLTPEQRERFGGYVLAKEERACERAALVAADERAAVLLTANGGDKRKAHAAAFAEIERVLRGVGQ